MQVKDHKGNAYPTIKAMCDEYHIASKTYRRRMNQGWSQEEALTTQPDASRYQVKDHKGNTFPTLKDMCEHYGLKPNISTTYKSIWLDKGKSAYNPRSVPLSLSWRITG